MGTNASRVRDKHGIRDCFFITNPYPHGPVLKLDGDAWSELSYPDFFNDLGRNPSVERVFAEGNDAIWIKIRYSVLEGSVSRTKYAFARTTDGIEWQRIEIPESAWSLREAFKFKGMVYIPNNSNSGILLQSDERFTAWQPISASSNSGSDLSVAHTTERLAILSGSGSDFTSLQVSSDGANFQSYALPETGNIKLVATESDFYVLGDSTWISSDGTSWSQYLPYRLNAATHFDEIYFYLDSSVMIEKARADLSVVRARVSEGDYAVGDKLEIEVTLENRGNQPIAFPGDARIDVTFHTEKHRRSKQADDEAFSSSAAIPIASLAPGQSESFTIEFSLPEGVRPGSYYHSLFIGSEFLSKDGNPSNDYFYQDSHASVTVPSRKLTIGESANGYVESPNRSEYALGEKILLTARPDFGYAFSGWTGDLEHGEETLLVTLNEDTSVTPTFSLRYYNVDLEIEGRGTVSGIPETELVQHGQALELSADPADEWVFVGWSGYGSETGKTLVAQAGRNLKIGARFGRPYSAWANATYGEGAEPRKSPESSSPIPHLSNLEHYVRGFEYANQRAAMDLGIFIENNALVLRYAVYKGVFEYEVTPALKRNDGPWKTGIVSLTKVDQTDDLNIFEARISPTADSETLLLSLAITPLTAE